MATFAKVRALSSALALTFVVALSLASAGAAHAAPRTTTKAAVAQNCNPAFWDATASAQGPLQVFEDHTWLVYGHYGVVLEHNDCDLAENRAYGYMSFLLGTGALCATDIMGNVKLFLNAGYTGKESSSIDTILGDTDNPPGCAHSDDFVFTPIYVNGDISLFCAEITGNVSWNNFQDKTRYVPDLATGYLVSNDGTYCV